MLKLNPFLKFSLVFGFAFFYVFSLSIPHIKKWYQTQEYNFVLSYIEKHKSVCKCEESAITNDTVKKRLSPSEILRLIREEERAKSLQVEGATTAE